MIFITPFILVFIAFFLIYKLPFFTSTQLSPWLLSFIFGLKLLAGFILYLIYSYYYPERNTGDTFKYFDDGIIMFNAFNEHPSDFFKMLSGIHSEENQLKNYYYTMNNWYKPYDYSAYNDNRLVIRLNALICFISKGNFHVHTIIFNFLAFTGLTAIFKILKDSINQKLITAIIVFLTPSVLLWSSGVLKESILLFALGMFIYFLFQFFRDKRYHHLIFSMIFIFLLALSKVYVLFAILPSLFAYFICTTRKTVYPFRIFTLVHLIILFTIFNLKHISNQFDIPSAIVKKQQDFNNVAEYSKAESAIQIPTLTTNFFSFIKATPEALINTFFRPFWWNVKKVIMVPNALESSGLMLLLITMFLFIKKPEMKILPLFWLCIFFSFTLAALIGMTTPVIGAIVRYKIPFMPFMLTAIFMCMNTEKVKNTLAHFTKRNN